MLQIPLGLAADKLGGTRLLVACLFLWSLATSLFAHTPSAKNPFVFMLAVRAALGLGQSCIMPAVSSLSARWLPPKQRSRCAVPHGVELVVRLPLHRGGIPRCMSGYLVASFTVNWRSLTSDKGGVY